MSRDFEVKPKPWNEDNQRISDEVEAMNMAKPVHVACLRKGALAQSLQQFADAPRPEPKPEPKPKRKYTGPAWNRGRGFYKPLTDELAKLDVLQVHVIDPEMDPVLLHGAMGRAASLRGKVLRTFRHDGKTYVVRVA